MAQGDQRSASCRRLFLASVFAIAALIAATQDSAARCVRLLQPGGWGYQTVCNNSGGGGGGGGGGYNYGAMLGAGAAFLGALQDFTNDTQGGGGSGAPSQPSCRAGYRVISGGGCAPSGAVDCGGGKYCPSGKICMPRNTCQTPDQVEWDRKYKEKIDKEERDRVGAATAELDDIKRRLTQPPANETAQASAALLPPRQANPFARGGASAPPDAAPSTARRPWNGEKDDCGNAGQLEKNTAAYFNMCGPKAPEKKAASYTPSIEPQTLTLRAKQSCAGLMGVDERTCVLKNKLAILLREDPAVREKCTALEGKTLLRCVDETYLYGPSGPTGAELKAVLLGTLATLPDGRPAVPQEKSPAVVAASAPPSECGPGFGMKPTAGAFGAWSCQRLGVLFFAPDRKTPIDSGSPEGAESVRQFEERINEVAALAAAHAVREVGGTLSDNDRKTCTAASYAAARGVLKGGSPDVPALCRSMALAAQAALAYYADAQNFESNPGVEDLLTAYIDGANATAVDEKKPALIGLEPTKEQRQQSDCMLRGQGPDCSGAPTPSSPPVRSVDTCTSAELHWKAVEDMKTIALYEDHLKRFPNCAFATLAAARIEQLRKR